MKKYLLKGGVVGLILFVIWLLDIVGDKIFFPGTWILTWNIFFNIGILHPTENILFTPIFYALSLLVLVVPCVLIAWLYGKIKNRNKDKNMV